jgi:hypothetical protein
VPQCCAGVFVEMFDNVSKLKHVKRLLLQVAYVMVHIHNPSAKEITAC